MHFQNFDALSEGEKWKVVMIHHDCDDDPMHHDCDDDQIDNIPLKE